MKASGKVFGPWNVRRLVIGVFLIALLAYGAGSVAYVAAFRAERDPETVIVAVSSGLEDDAARLAGDFVAAGSGRKVVLLDFSGNELKSVEPGGTAGPDTGAPGAAGEGAAGAGAGGPDEGKDLAQLLRDGAVDFVLAAGQALAQLGPYLAPSEAVTFRHAELLAVSFPSARVAVSLEEATDVIAGLATGVQPSWPGGVELISLGDRSPDRQLLEVDGVYPTLATVLDGSYPLVSEVRLAERQPSGFWGLVARMPFVRGLTQANASVVSEFGTWLATEEARASFHGTPYEITLTAVGDVMLGRGSASKINQFGLDYPFELVGERLSAGDITFCNLEAPLGTTGTMIPGKEIWLRGKPEYVECLKKAGIDVLNLANNHILDFDSPCLLETMDILNRNQIAYDGAGTDVVAARKPAILEAHGLKVAFLGYTEFADPGLFWDFHYRRSFVASETQPGCNPLDMAMVAEDVSKAKTLADVVVVVYHWGMEDIPYPQAFNPNNNLEAIARQTIDLGANLVLGTHPHAVQGYEAYRGGLIAYSLGNFVNDQKWDTQKESMILELQVGPSGVLSARVTPCWIESTRPRFMQGEESKRLLEKIAEISVKFRSHR